MARDAGRFRYCAAVTSRERAAVQHGFHSHVASVRAALDPMAFVEAPVMPAPHFGPASDHTGDRTGHSAGDDTSGHVADGDRASLEGRRGLRGWWEQQLVRLVDPRAR